MKLAIAPVTPRNFKPTEAAICMTIAPGIA
jgi:hypothetical protein